MKKKGKQVKRKKMLNGFLHGAAMVAMLAEIFQLSHRALHGDIFAGELEMPVKCRTFSRYSRYFRTLAFLAILANFCCTSPFRAILLAVLRFTAIPPYLYPLKIRFSLL